MRYDDNDDDLLASLRRVAAEVDPVPDAVRRAARLAIATRDLDSQLARLVADSAGTAPDLAYELVRAPDPPDDRFLTFDGGGVRIELEVSGAPADGLTLIGQVTGAHRGECLLEGGDGGRQEVGLDGLGRFLLSGVPTGPVRFRCPSLAGRSVATPWVNL